MKKEKQEQRTDGTNRKPNMRYRHKHITSIITLKENDLDTPITRHRL